MGMFNIQMMFDEIDEEFDTQIGDRLNGDITVGEICQAIEKELAVDIKKDRLLPQRIFSFVCKIASQYSKYEDKGKEIPESEITKDSFLDWNCVIYKSKEISCEHKRY